MCCHTPHSLAPEVNEPVIQNSWYTLLNTTMLESWQLRLHFQESHICECVQHDASFLDHTQVVWLVKVKLCLYKQWKCMGAAGVQLYSFLAVALDGSEVNIMHHPARSRHYSDYNILTVWYWFVTNHARDYQVITYAFITDRVTPHLPVNFWYKQVDF